MLAKRIGTALAAVLVIAPLAIAPLTIAPLGLNAARAEGQKLVLYTSQPDAIAAETVAAFRKQDPDVDVQVFRSGTTQVMNKLQAEIAAGAPQADVLLIADAMSMEALKAAGDLLPDPKIDVSHLPAGTYDAGRTYFGTKLITTGIAMNTAKGSALTLPDSWLDLLKPYAKGQVVLPSPLYSGAALITLGAFAQNKAIGPDFMSRLAKNGATAVAGNGGVLTAVANGQDAYGILVDFMALNAARKGSPVRFIFPKEGVVPVTEPVAVLKAAKNAAAARAFVAFLLSREGQELAAKQGFLPVRDDVAPPPGFPPRNEIKLMPVDTEKLLHDAKKLKQNFADAFGG